MCFDIDTTHWNRLGTRNKDGTLYSDSLNIWNAEEKEAYLTNLLQALYSDEFETYKRMQDVQGKDIPRLVAAVLLPDYYSSPHTSPTLSFQNLWSTTSGLLLQYIPNAYTLEELYSLRMPPQIPVSAFQYICDDAIHTVRKFMARGIMNADVNVRNTLIWWSGEKYKVFLIDFGHCCFKDECPEEVGEHGWRTKQALVDEEGAIGRVMEANLKVFRGGGFTYRESKYGRRLRHEYQVKDWEEASS